MQNGILMKVDGERPWFVTAKDTVKAKRARDIAHAPGETCGRDSQNGQPPLHQNPATKVSKFDECEQKIEANRGKLILAGRALQECRDKELFKPKFHSWADYCRDRWRISRQAANYLIAQAKVAQNLKLPDDFPATRLRPLARLTLAHQREAWAVAASMTRNGIPSGALIEIAARKFTQKLIFGWTLKNFLLVARRDFVRTLRRGLHGATDDQKQEALALVGDMLDHAIELIK